ncbi:hypothetical protein S83_011638 [Arachis hypogaea]
MELICCNMENNNFINNQLQSRNFYSFFAELLVLRGATLHNNHNCNLKHWCGQFQLVPLSALILPDVTMLY